MLVSENGVEFSTGMSGSGKTRSMKVSLAEWMDDGGRALILDNAGDDWPGNDFFWDGNVAMAEDVYNARRLIRQGYRCVAFRPGPPVFTPATWAPGTVTGVVADKAKPRHAPIIEHVCNIVIEESTKEKPLALVISETQVSLPNKPLAEDSQAFYLLTNYRHRGAAVLLDSQRFAAVSSVARAQVRTLRVFAMASPQDMDALSAIHRELPIAVARCADAFSRDEVGWHIELDPRAPRPPFVPQKWDEDRGDFIYMNAQEVGV